jgi:hypothetical protein
MGGNIFEFTTSIEKNRIHYTIDAFTQKMQSIFPVVPISFTVLGSAGKKDSSNDIDLGLNVSTVLDKGSNPKLIEWNLDMSSYDSLYELTRKRARTATEYQSKINVMIKLIAAKMFDNGIVTSTKGSGSGSLFCVFPQYDVEGETLDFVQIDINVGDIEWLNFSYYSETYESNVKGLHRTQLLVSLFANKNMTFRHGTGIYNSSKDMYEARTPNEAIKLLNRLYSINLTESITKNFFLLYEYLVDNLDKNELDKVFDTYLKILDSTRADIPYMLQDYWLSNRMRLGLQGKFLPENSNLIKCV